MVIRRPTSRSTPLSISDSLSQCDPTAYSSIYDVRNRSDVKRVSSTQPIHKDTLEISRDKLQKDALSRLRHTSKYFIFQTGFMRVGKYLFLAVAFPPYLVIYGIPKWIIVQGLPAILSICQTAFKKVQQKVKKRLDAVKNKMQQIILIMRQKIQHLISPLVRLAMEMQQAFTRLRQAGALFIKRLGAPFKKLPSKAAIKHTLKNILNKPRDKFKALVARAQQRKDQVQEWLVQQKVAIVQVFQTGFSWIYRVPSWSRSGAKRLSQKVKNVSQPWQRRFSRSQEMAQKTTAWLAKQFKQASQTCQQACQPLVGFCRQALKVVRQAGKKARGRLCEFFNDKRKRSLHFLEQGQEKVKKWVFQKVSDGFLSRLLSILPASWQLAIKNFLIKIMTRSLTAILQAARFVIQGSYRAVCFLSNGWKTGWSYLSKGWAKGMTYLAWAGRVVGQGLKKGLYATLVGLIMLNIVGLWGLQFLGEKMQAFTSLLPFVKRQNQ